MNSKIQDIEGIGPKYAEMLNLGGIFRIGDLLAKACQPTGREEIAERCGINRTLILKWINMSDLFRIKGVAAQYAELLEAAGVDTVKELRNRNPENLADKMREVNREKRLLRAAPGVKAVTSWVEQANKLEPAVYY